MKRGRGRRASVRGSKGRGKGNTKDSGRGGKKGDGERVRDRGGKRDLRTFDLQGFEEISSDSYWFWLLVRKLQKSQ